MLSKNIINVIKKIWLMLSKILMLSKNIINVIKKILLILSKKYY